MDSESKVRHDQQPAAILHRHIGQIHVPYGAIGLQGLKGTQYINDESTTPRRK